MVTHTSTHCHVSQYFNLECKLHPPHTHTSSFWGSISNVLHYPEERSVVSMMDTKLRLRVLLLNRTNSSQNSSVFEQLIICTSFISTLSSIQVLHDARVPVEVIYGLLIQTSHMVLWKHTNTQHCFLSRPGSSVYVSVQAEASLESESSRAGHSSDL